LGILSNLFLIAGLEPKTFCRNTNAQSITERHECLKFPGIPLQKGESFEHEDRFFKCSYKEGARCSMMQGFFLPNWWAALPT